MIWRRARGISPSACRSAARTKSATWPQRSIALWISLQPIVREAGDVAQRTGVEIGAMTLRNAGADAAAGLQRDEVAESLRALSQMADEAQAESHAMQAALQQVVDIRQATDENSRTSAEVGSLIEALAGQVQAGSQGDRTAGSAKRADRSGVDGNPSVSPSKPTCWRSTRPLRRHALVRPGAVLRWWRTKCVRWPVKPRAPTGDIQAHIVALQQGAREAVETIGKAGRQASEGLLVLRESERLQQTVQASVEQVHAAIGLATRAAEHQAQGAHAVRGRVEVIHAQAERAAQAVVETTASGKVLDGLAAQLKASSGSFALSIASMAVSATQIHPRCQQIHRQPRHQYQQRRIRRCRREFHVRGMRPHCRGQCVQPSRTEQPRRRQFLHRIQEYQRKRCPQRREDNRQGHSAKRTERRSTQRARCFLQLRRGLIQGGANRRLSQWQKQQRIGDQQQRRASDTAQARNARRNTPAPSAITRPRQRVQQVRQALGPDSQLAFVAHHQQAPPAPPAPGTTLRHPTTAPARMRQRLANGRHSEKPPTSPRPAGTPACPAGSHYR